MSQFFPIQAQAFLLYGNGANIGDTSIVLSSFKDIDGSVITMQGTVMTGTIEPNSGSSEEQIIFTGVTQNPNGTATITGVKSVAFKTPYTQTTGVVKSHAGNTTFVLSDTAYLYTQYPSLGNDQVFSGSNTFTLAPFVPTVSSSQTSQAASIGYVNSFLSTGAPKASNTVFGITELSIAAATASVPIAVGVNNTNSGTSISGSNNVVDVADTVTTSTASKVTRTNGSGFLDISFLPLAMPTGSMMMYAGSAAPSNFLLCDASAVSRTTFAALFAVIGTTFGVGNGTTTFNVPDMRGRVAVGVGTGTGGGASGTGLPTGGSALTAVSRAGWKGEETHQLTVPELASHTHNLPYVTTGSGSIVLDNVSAGASTINTSSTGGDTAHNNIQPILGIFFIIKT